MNFIPLIVTLIVSPIIIYFIIKKSKKDEASTVKSERSFSKPFTVFLNIFDFISDYLLWFFGVALSLIFIYLDDGSYFWAWCYMLAGSIFGIWYTYKKRKS